MDQTEEKAIALNKARLLIEEGKSDGALGFMKIGAGLDLVARLRRPLSSGDLSRVVAEAKMLMIQLQRCRE